MTEPKSTPPQIFHRFFDRWLVELNTHLEQLVAAANHHEHDSDNDNDNEDDSALRMLIDKSVRHYEEYYKVKSDAAKGDVISMFSHKWLTSLEDAFLWIAGWRPTTAIHLLYSKSGLQLETRLRNLIPTFNAGDLGNLSSGQMNQVDELQKKTILEERKISEKMAKLQESAADTPMVSLSNAVSDLIRQDSGSGGTDSDSDSDSDRRVESVLEPKKDGLEKLLNRADGLRMETLKSVIRILTPIQAVYFLIAAAELHLRLHDWGLKKDADLIS